MIEPHPLVVHFPIGLLVAACFFLIGFLTTKRPLFQNIFVQTFFLGLCGLLAALLTGLAQEDELIQNKAIHELLELHETMGYVALVCFVLLFIWKLKRRSIMKHAELLAYVVLYMISVGVLAYGAHCGGQMVYLHGAGVEPMQASIKAEGFVPPED
ncbi:MAG: DUF2231 domain-containing protein [Oligoflexia bacterium]|nr:DUF2231 domain-containing protein [Oligoflexia bacterium]